MAKVYKDDVTGETYDSNEKFRELGLQAGWAKNGPKKLPEESIEVHRNTVLNQPDAVADRLHEMVDDWKADVEEHLDDDGETEAYTECHSCGYVWEYSGNQQKATCPSCSNKTRA